MLRTYIDDNNNKILHILIMIIIIKYLFSYRKKIRQIIYTPSLCNKTKVYNKLKFEILK